MGLPQPRDTPKRVLGSMATGDAEAPHLLDLNGKTNKVGRPKVAEVTAKATGEHGRQLSSLNR